MNFMDWYCGERKSAASEDPDVEREQFYRWGVWRQDPHDDGEGGEA